jgi:hypothetical protein
MAITNGMNNNKISMAKTISKIDGVKNVLAKSISIL